MQDDKTHCGDFSRIDIHDQSQLKNLAEKLAVTVQDILFAIEQVGNNRQKVEEFFHNKENAY